MKLEIELTTAQVAVLEFLRACTDAGRLTTNAQLAQQFVTERLVEELSSDHIRQEWAHWCVTGTFPVQDGRGYRV